LHDDLPILLALDAGAAALGTGPPDGRHHEVTAAERCARRRLLDHSEVLVPEDQVRAARRRVAELGGLDVDVRAADAGLEHADEGLPFIALWLGDVVADGQAVGAAGNDGDGTHREVDFITKADAGVTELAPVLVEVVRHGAFDAIPRVARGRARLV